ncbi:MAG: DNA mismatch repair endonuclease MutL [Myxococcales bacterium]|nr:DNA mismatch repair endonuclease MutL [Polyangiaceae bacterium]MDW8251739.1 DNA mismatch repair endonuclease MutL [Myxococcales bacterium]
MGRVQRLPEELANQIAAGEVVERPASVVKELVENSLDAEANRIQVDVEGGGIDLLRITDDGIGMSEEDALLAIERHATSKIHRFDDLLNLRTFGFRGEALPSIASVSHFLLRTRSRDADEGVEIRVDGGAPPQIKPCGAPPGTTIEIRELFYNVPARRKFLKAASTELAHITEVIEGVALAFPQLTLTLRHHGKTLREWLRRNSRGDRARETFENEELAEIFGSRGDLKIEALLGRPERARSNTSALKIFVNGRQVRDRLLLRAVAQAYGSVLEPGRYPLGALFLEIHPEQVDVNVHPQKAEVRFAETREVVDAVQKILGAELARAFGAPTPAQPYRTPPGAASAPAQPRLWAPPSSSAPTRPLPPVFPASVPLLDDAPSPPARSPLPPAMEREIPGMRLVSSIMPKAEEQPAAPLEPSATPFSPGVAPVPVASPIAPSRPPPGSDAREPFGGLRFLVQVRQMFLVCEGKEGLYVLDQHAAAERVTFHRLKRAFASRSVAIQPLLFPVMVDVQAEEAALVEEQQDMLLAAGMDVRSVGPRSVTIHGVPQILRHASPERLLRDLLAEASRGGHAAFSDAIDLSLATMACHGSVRAGDRMTPEEATALLVALDTVDFAGHCPHGRPVVTVMRWTELERKVGRR